MVRQHQTSDAQWRIGESRGSGFDASSHRNDGNYLAGFGGWRRRSLAGW
jgi:hypothetical protein